MPSADAPARRDWLVGAAIIEGPGGVLLVQNRRRDGSLDWSPPGGVIEVHEGETILDGLAREVVEETGLVVTEWEGPVYEVEVEALCLGWSLRVETYRARSFAGALTVADPDGIVVDARFVHLDAWPLHLDQAHPWVREPVMAFLTPAADPAETRWRYRVDGAPGPVEVIRLPPG